MAELDAAAIERLLHEGARQRGIAVGAYRELVEAIAGPSGIAFEKALQIITYYDVLAPDERQSMFETIAAIDEAAARYGVSVDKFAEIMLRDERKPPSGPPSRH